LSTSHNDALWLRPYGEIDTSVPDCGVRVLPGRLAALTHPLNKGRTVLLPDREWYDPDVCTVVSSGLEGFDPGDVVILAPDHGAYYPDLSPDKRECRMVGVARPWWESVLAKYDADGIHPAPGWMLVRFGGEEVGKFGEIDIRTPRPPNARTSTATALASCGDDWTEPHKGERVCIQGMRTYSIRMEGAAPAAPSHKRGVAGATPSHDLESEPTIALVRAPIASKKWLSSLRKQT
jgi:hypothetical protein